jgi:quinol monooxygenase YgiN
MIKGDEMTDTDRTTQTRLTARLVPKPGKEADLTAAISETVLDVVQEPGCLTYIAHHSDDQSGTVVMYEAWQDDEALATHLKAPAFTKLAARFDELLAEPLGVEHLRRFA